MSSSSTVISSFESLGTITTCSVHWARQAVHPKHSSLLVTMHSPFELVSKTLTRHTEAHSPLPLHAFMITLKAPRGQSVIPHLRVSPLRRLSLLETRCKRFRQTWLPTSQVPAKLSMCVLLHASGARSIPLSRTL